MVVVPALFRTLVRFRYVLAATLAVTCMSAAAEVTSITVVPANPTSSTPIQLQVAGPQGSSTPIYFYGFVLFGPTLTVEGCVPPGFATGNHYEFAADIGQLSPGTYQVVYITQDCGPQEQPGLPYGPQEIRATINFTVLSSAAAASVIPTLQPGSIGALGVLIALAGAILYRRRIRVAG